MMRGSTVAIFCLLPALVAGSERTTPVTVRGRTHTLVHLEPERANKPCSVIFLPGDGGWRGTAVAMAKTIASWGYDVYGFDTKKYLEAYAGGGLSRDDMAADMRLLAARIAADSHRPVVFVGWSQGAGMAVAAAASASDRSALRGVLTLGLPATAVLGWDWKATVAVIARQEPDQPKFEVKPLLASAARAPVWMIYGTLDEYTKPGTARELYASAAEPKQWREIAGANHRFDGRQDELFRSIREGLEWVASL